MLNPQDYKDGVSTNANWATKRNNFVDDVLPLLVQLNTDYHQIDISSLKNTTENLKSKI